MNYIIYYDYIIGSPAMCEHNYFTEDKLPLQLIQADSFAEAYNEFIVQCPEDKVPVIFVEPLVCACVTFIYPALSVYQRLVGGMIEIIGEPSSTNADIICNDEGKLMHLRLNRALRSEGRIYDVISGNMIICFRDEDEWAISPSPIDIERVYELYKEPEVFYMDDKNRNINSIKCNPELAQLMRENNISLINKS